AHRGSLGARRHTPRLCWPSLLRPCAFGGAPRAVAQLVERLLCEEKVRSSNLLGSTARVVGVSSEVRRNEAISTRGEEASPRITSFRMIVRSSPCTSLCRARTRVNGEP